MPLIVRWPGHVRPGKVDESTVMSAVDFFPMICKIAGASPPGNVQFDGEDLSEALFGNGATRKHPLFWEYGRNAAFGYPKGRDRSPNVAVRDGKWKLLLNADGTGSELYDLQKDRNENKCGGTKSSGSEGPGNRAAMEKISAVIRQTLHEDKGVSRQITSPWF
jgi:arylsulfatase A-like enzyme